MARTKLRRLSRHRRASADDEAPDEAPEEDVVPADLDADVLPPDLDAPELPAPVNVLPEGVNSTRAERPKFTDNDLMKEEGMEWLVKNMPQLAKFQRKSAAADAVRLVNLYKAWCHRLFAKLPFEDMLGRIDKFGSKAHVRNVLDKMRDEQAYPRAKRPRDEQDEPPQEEPPQEDAMLPPQEDPIMPPQEETPEPQDEDEKKKMLRAKRLAAIELRRQRQLAKQQQEGIESQQREVTEVA